MTITASAGDPSPNVKDNPQKKKKGERPSRARYGTGSLWLRHSIWWVKWREVKHNPDGTVVYVQHAESTKSSDREFAEGILRKKILALGGRRPTVVDPTQVTYEDLRANYLAHLIEQKRRSLKKDKAGKTTLATLPRLDAFFRGWRAREISVADLRRFRAEGTQARHARGLGLSDARLNRYIATLRAMFKQAARDELITSAEMPAYFPMATERNEARGAIYMEDAWYQKLRRVLPEPLRSGLIVAYNTGVRVAELQRIRWRDLDLDKRLIRMTGETTKTGRPRFVPLPKEFNRKPAAPDALVFPLGSYRKRWIKACVAVGAGRWIETPEGKKHYEGLLLRHSRHTAVRNMSDAGLPEARIMGVSGHKTRAMFDRYNIGRGERDAIDAAKAIERFHRTRRRKS